jgi:hypothetical protein
MAGKLGIVKPNNHVVAVQRIHDDFCVKIFSVDARGAGIKRVGNLGEWGRRVVWSGRVQKHRVFVWVCLFLAPGGCLYICFVHACLFVRCLKHAPTALLHSCVSVCQLSCRRD